MDTCLRSPLLMVNTKSPGDGIDASQERAEGLPVTDIDAKLMQQCLTTQDEKTWAALHRKRLETCNTVFSTQEQASTLSHMHARRILRGSHPCPQILMGSFILTHKACRAQTILTKV